MCGRYAIALKDAPPELARAMEALKPGDGRGNIKTGGEVFPSDRVAALANSRQGRPRIFPMAWGYSLEGGKRIINARWETAADRPLFQDGMRRRRCLIPASCYFEWEKGREGRVKYAIGPREGGLMYMAGIYRLERRGEALVPAFAVLTREAAPQLAFIHHRMPVVLSPQSAGDWLDIGRPAEQVLAQARLDLEFWPA